MKYTFFVLVCSVASFVSTAQLNRFSYSQPKMGSPLNIIFYAKDSTTAKELSLRCFTLVDTLNAIFSDYMPNSELNNLSNRAGKDSFVFVSPLLYDILLQGQKAWQYSYYSFDITIGPLSHLWRKARKSKIFPDPGEVKQAKALTGFDKLVIDTNNHRIKLIQPGTQLDLGGIAKGYVAQKLVDFLKANGIQHSLADAGGDLATGDAPPNSKGWNVGVNIPENAETLLPHSLLIQNKAVATSGDIYQYIEHEGKKYSHIIDPATGYGVTFQRNVTVIADDGATADWLATACSILPFSKARKVIKQMHAALLITYLKNEKIKFYSTKNFDAYWNTSRK